MPDEHTATVTDIRANPVTIGKRVSFTVKYVHRDPDCPGHVNTDSYVDAHCDHGRGDGDPQPKADSPAEHG